MVAKKVAKKAAKKTVKKAARKVTKKRTVKKAAKKSAASTVWRGTIARLRIYDQPDSTGNRVFVYVAPGANADYVGNSADPNMIKALFLARDNGNTVSGYTNAAFRIEWLDY